MPTTYEPIATTTLSSAAASITFSSIPATYTDLRLVVVLKGDATADGNGIYVRYNSDSGSNYSITQLQGNGTAAASNRGTNYTGTYPFYNGISSAQWFLLEYDLFSYAGSTNKTNLSSAAQDKNGSGFVERQVGLWRNTSAVTSLSMTLAAGNFVTGTTATLYGIKNA